VDEPPIHDDQRSRRSLRTVLKDDAIGWNTVVGIDNVNLAIIEPDYCCGFGGRKHKKSR